MFGINNLFKSNCVESSCFPSSHFRGTASCLYCPHSRPTASCLYCLHSRGTASGSHSRYTTFGSHSRGTASTTHSRGTASALYGSICVCISISSISDLRCCLNSLCRSIEFFAHQFVSFLNLSVASSLHPKFLSGCNNKEQLIAKVVSFPKFLQHLLSSSGTTLSDGQLFLAFNLFSTILSFNN